ncbi:BirA family transcriptional regulator, biotin operon repressor / biotin-[acetyl-CoA-carboxylase] ligase [Arachidicoccus rhizosphaerae]|jgi:BirA family biotin operon repressor/biotin-[acetyl-CoA-carboxylase] ligase|uniref:BirA family transcriptional regulator, biotin operon repressor / biotin-[acetyl-CoA-carboxylase] ligase n=1 Tax=Arachidicoccus rhizosphaerae TaxID=551991 RepID=A0A1H3Y9B2_9BACT|nr:biotin--[acetyl-CoA-carboxylase] ligase [Arachidicoccus rhizosphaerae]SEA07601.1 BirA family transcriptional regulator, biotin operon repressor / biotin-[acetyl-CoA-carboxylase] ligase [Arachidicoccus rhizosphaerae]
MIGNPLTILDEVESSNNYATTLALQGLAKHGHAILARFQSRGKGQRGRSWQGAPGQNIALSVILDMKGVALTRNFELSMAIALGVFDFFSHYGGEKTRIKWPNDIYWSDRKAVGILIENNIKGKNWQWAVAGMGINMNQTQFSDQMAGKAVSLRQITGKSYDIEDSSRELCTFLEKRYQQFLEDAGTLLSDYNQVLYAKNQTVPIRYQGVATQAPQDLEVVIEAVDAQGRLWITGAPVPYFQFGEIQWLIEPGK